MLNSTAYHTNIFFFKKVSFRFIYYFTLISFFFIWDCMSIIHKSFDKIFPWTRAIEPDLPCDALIKHHDCNRECSLYVSIRALKELSIFMLMTARLYLMISLFIEVLLVCVKMKVNSSYRIIGKRILNNSVNFLTFITQLFLMSQIAIR